MNSILKTTSPNEIFHLPLIKGPLKYRRFSEYCPRTVLPELWPTPPSIHISLQLYNTRRNQSDSMFLEVPYFVSAFSSRKHFGLSFVYDAPMIWNDLPDEVRSANSVATYTSRLKSCLEKHNHSHFPFPCCLHGADTCNVSGLGTLNNVLRHFACVLWNVKIINN